MDDQKRRRAAPLPQIDSGAQPPHPPPSVGVPQARLSVPSAGIVPADPFFHYAQFVMRSICRLFVDQNVNPGGGSAALILAGTGLGTGFLIDTDRVLTCRHVGHAKEGTLAWTDLRVEFPACGSDEVYRVAEVLYESTQPDCAVLRLNKVPTDASGRPLRPLPFNDLTAPEKLKNMSIRMLGYSHREGSGDRLLYLAAHGLVTEANAWQVLYECETLGGNSGSPVFGGENWVVLAMHTNAGVENVDTKKVASNCGIPISTVWRKAGPKLYPTTDSYKVAPIQPSECEGLYLHFPSLTAAEPTPLLGFPPSRRKETCPRCELPPLIKRLLSAQYGTRLALWGMGGAGKSTLVLSAISDPRVSSRFKFMFWISVSERTMTDYRISMLNAFHRLAWPSLLEPTVDSVRDYALQLQVSWQQHKPVPPPLVVVDNVWSSEDAEMFENVPITLILTTRDQHHADAFKASVIQVERLSDADQDRMLLQLSQVPAEKDAEARPRVLARCGGLPLAINVVARMVRNRNADEPWQDALRLFQSHRVGNAAPTDGDATMYSTLLTSSALLSKPLAAHWSSLCVFPVERWVPEGLVHLLWRVKEPTLKRPDVHAYVTELFTRGLVEINSAGNRQYMRLHAMMRDALFWKLGQAGVGDLTEQMLLIPPLAVLKLSYKEEWKREEWSDWWIGESTALMHGMGYDRWKSVSPADLEAMIRTADDESAVSLHTLHALDICSQEQWLAALQDIEPSVVLQLLERDSPIVRALWRYPRWNEVMQALSPATLRTLIRKASLSLRANASCFGLFPRWDEVFRVLQPADLTEAVQSPWWMATNLITFLSKRGFRRWDIIDPAAVAKCLQLHDTYALPVCQLLKDAGYTRWEEVDKLSTPEIAQQRRDIAAMDK